MRETGGHPVLEAFLGVRCYRISVSPDGSRLFCQEDVPRSDIWLVENLDPEMAKR